MSDDRLGKLVKRFRGGQGNDDEIAPIRSEDFVRDLDAEVKRLSSLFRFALKYQQQFQPSGVEFSGLRKYLVTDDASRIDWKHSASKPELYVKQYEDEKNMDTFILLDVSDSMIYGTGDKLKTEYAATVAATLSYASVDAGLNVGIGLYGADDFLMSPNGGKEQHQKILNEVTRNENYGGQFNLKKALNDVIAGIKDDTVIFVISDFIDIGEDWEATMRVASKKFRHVMVLMTRDLRDYELPDSGVMNLESLSGDKKFKVNTDNVKQRFESIVEENEQEIQDSVEGAGGSFLKFNTREDFATTFASYFDEEGGEW